MISTWPCVLYDMKRIALGRTVSLATRLATEGKLVWMDFGRFLNSKLANRK